MIKCYIHGTNYSLQPEKYNNQYIHPWLLGISVYAYLMFPHRGSSYYYGLTLILAWISNHIASKVWDEIIYLYSYCNGANIFHLTLS